ncbi:hypothetical protein BDR22DRAFT_908148 [Usnea florida]
MILHYSLENSTPQNQLQQHSQITPSQPPVQSFPASPGPQLRAEELGYFDPESQQEYGSSNGPFVNTGKHIFFKDIYIFTNRLKESAVPKGEAGIKAIITSCLRGSALM